MSKIKVSAGLVSSESLSPGLVDSYLLESLNSLSSMFLCPCLFS